MILLLVLLVIPLTAVTPSDQPPPAELETLLERMSTQREHRRNSPLIDAIGYLAGLLATLAFLPQVLKTLKDRTTRDISLPMYSLFCIGVSLWLVYGILISSWPVLVSNAVTLVLAGTVLVLKIKYG